MNTPPLAEELKTAQEVARRAGRLILNYYRTGLPPRFKDDQSPVTRADLEANALITEHLAAAFPNDRLLSEEAEAPAEYTGEARTWCVDPLDGTREFIDGNGEFTVMIGLAVHGEAALGVLYQPTEDLLVWGCNGRAGATRGGATLPVGVSSVTTLAGARVAVSRRRHPPLPEAVRRSLGDPTFVPLGGMGIKVLRVAMGDAELYLSESDLAKEWDTCAPEAVLRAAGGLMTDGFGRPLRYNKTPPGTPWGWVASNGALHQAGLNAVRPSLKARTAGKPV